MQQDRKPITRISDEDYYPSRNQTPVRGRKADESRLRAIRVAILAVSACVFLLGLTLMILPLFRVRTVKVVGNSRYTTEAILAEAGVREGEELFSLDLQTIADRLSRNQYVDSVAVSIRFPSTLRIEIKEKGSLLYTEFGGRYFSLDGDLRVTGVSGDETVFAEYLRVTLPEIAGITVGKPIRFADAEKDYSYISELLSVLAPQEFFPALTSLDVSRKYNVSYTMHGCCKVIVGKVSDLAQKMQLAERILLSNGGIGDECAVIDVSDVQKTSYRTVNRSEL